MSHAAEMHGAPRTPGPGLSGLPATDSMDHHPVTIVHASPHSQPPASSSPARPAAAATVPAHAEARAAELLARPVGPVDAYMAAFVATLDIPENLREAVRYALLGGGKRLRPALAWYSAAAVGAAGEASLPGGAAVELVHAFSLVHDDLPAMDDDDMRRGRPTLHRHTSEAMAILAGDGMLNFAYQLLLERATAGPGGPALASALARELAVGTTGMIAGQIYDTLGGFSPDLAPADRLRLIHVNKTGALIRASCRMGALCGLAAVGRLDAAAGRQALGAVDRYADAVGLMFQIVDDIVDETQTTEHAGKRTGKDREAGKLTYPGVLGLERSRTEVRQLLDGALRACEELGAPGEPLGVLAAYLAVRTR